MPTHVELWTDGACSGNPGPGGWAFVLVAYRDGQEIRRLERNGYAPASTNNRMELQACIEGLRALSRGTDVTVHSDARYIVDAFNLGWVERWKALGWRRKLRGAKGGLRNPDLWQELDREVARHNVTWVRIPGHAGHVLNERCDVLAVAASHGLDMTELRVVH